YGLFSPNKLVQHAALKAFFASQPALRFYVDGSGIKDQDSFARSIRNVSGTVDRNKRGFFTIKVGKFNPESACYLHVNDHRCFVRVSETEVAINPWRENWLRMTLNDQGELTGVADFDPAAPIMVPVTN